MPYQQPLDIWNRALQRLGRPRMGTVLDQNEGQEIANVYDKVRRAELRRNLWTFATRTASLRALDTTSSIVNFEAWASGTTYAAGYIVMYQNLAWISLINGNVGNPPGNAVNAGQIPWDLHFGPQTANAWNDSIQNTITTNNTSYRVGELVFLMTTGAIYTSILDNNQNEPDTVDAWSATVMYSSGAVVSFNSVNYQSRVNRNFGFEPDTSPTQWTLTVTNPTVSGSWVQLANATLSSAPIVYPVTAGPASDVLSRNAYYLPSGYLRMAPQSPKAGSSAWLGAHVGLPYSDLIVQGNYITGSSAQTQTILRFIADVTDVTVMDDMFAEGFSARLAWELAPVIAPDMRRDAKMAYEECMNDARLVDAIELGPVEQDEDEFITCRL